MKRALLLLLVLVLALAVWFARDGSRVPADGSPSVVGEFVVADATPAGLDATGDETMGKREGLAPGGAVPATREPTLAIRVVFARTDEPVDGGSGELLYTHPSGTFPSGQVPTQLRSLHLDAHGRCVVSLPAGAHLLSLRIEPLSTIAGARGCFLRRRLELDQDLGSAGGELRIEVESAPELAGRVLDAVTLAPIAGARISLAGREQFLPPAETELDGWFSLGPFDPLPAGIVLAIEHPDYPAASRIVDLHEAAAVEIRLARGFRVSGRIADAKGTPVGQGRLELHLVRLHGQGDTRALRTKVDTLSDASGEFRFPPVVAAGGATIEFSPVVRASAAYAGIELELGPLEADLGGLELVVESAVRVRLRAERPDGSLAAAREVSFDGDGVVLSSMEEARDGRGRMVLLPLGRAVEVGAHTSGADGGFLSGSRTWHILAGELAPEEFVIPLQERSRLVLPPEPEDSLRFELAALPFQRGAVDLRVIDAARDQPIAADTTLKLSSRGNRAYLQGWSEGRLRVLGPPGRHWIEVEAASGAHDAFEVVIPLSGHAQAECRLRLGR